MHGAYYVLLHLWISVFGTSLTVLRLPGVLGMVGAAVCVSLTGERLFGRFEGLTAGLVFALIPAVARYATEVRSIRPRRIRVGTGHSASRPSA